MASASIEQLFEKYKIVTVKESDIHREKVIGSGGTSTVYKATWKGKEVAVKQYDKVRLVWSL